MPEKQPTRFLRDARADRFFLKYERGASLRALSGHVQYRQSSGNRLEECRYDLH